MSQHTEPTKILILRFSSLGDIVLTTPILTKLRRAFPHAKIHMVVKKEFLDLIQENPNLDKAIGFDSSLGFSGLWEFIKEVQRNRYNVFVDIHRSLRSRLVLWFNKGLKLRYSKDTYRRFVLLNFRRDLYKSMPRKILDYLKPLSHLGIEIDLEPTAIYFNEKDRAKAREKAKAKLTQKTPQLAQDLFNKVPPLSSRKVIGISPGAAHFLKKWPLEKYKELVFLLSDAFQPVFIVFGGPDDFECSHLGNLPLPIINLQDSLTLKETSALISDCDLFIGNDSGLAHVAEAVGVDSYVFFGPTSRHFGYAPYREKSHIFEIELSCRPCSRNGRGKCKNPSIKKCLEDIQSADVARQIIDYFNK